MRTILHPDYWVAIPAGNFLTGISDIRAHILRREWLRNKVDYEHKPEELRRLIDSAIEKFRDGSPLNKEEQSAFFNSFTGSGSANTTYTHAMTNVGNQESVYVEQFYIARFPITELQMTLLKQGIPAKELPGALEDTTAETTQAGAVRAMLGKVWKGFQKSHLGSCVAEVSLWDALSMCEQLGARLPTALEWEKAARGTDGRIYPWGDVWNPEAGYFYEGQRAERYCGDGRTPVDAYPLGVSPYGVWNMAGGLPEYVQVESASRATRGTETLYEERIHISVKGFHPRQSSADGAFLDHVVARPGYDAIPQPATLRLVLDHLPGQ